jgi:hypothetical protein
MYIELGLAISRSEETGKHRIYIVGEDNKRSLMHLHPKIIPVDKLRDVFSKEEINTQNP